MVRRDQHAMPRGDRSAQLIRANDLDFGRPITPVQIAGKYRFIARGQSVP